MWLVFISKDFVLVPVLMSVTEYCMDPDANLIFDEESLQAAIDMYNDRVVSEKHMVRKKLNPAEAININRNCFWHLILCRFTENPTTLFRDVLKYFTPFGKKNFQIDNRMEFVCLEIVSAYYLSCIWKKKLS